MLPLQPNSRFRTLVGMMLTCIVIASHVSGPIVKAAEPDSRPNVVLILVDDLGLIDIGIEGSSFYQTPHIDKLAKSGMRFTAGYANCRVCSPSRASIQLGTFPARHGITQWIGGKAGLAFKRGEALLPADYERQLPAAATTLPEALKQSGYKTFFAGKWHLGGDDSLPTDHGYDINVGGHHRGSPPGGYFAPYSNPQMEDGPNGEPLTIRLANETAGFIQATQDQPYFAMLSFYAVHGPLQTSKDRWQKYRDTAPPAPADGNRFKVDRTLPVRQIQDNPVYAGMMETLDDAVGIVIQSLEASGDLENTIVIFTGDNGGVSSGDGFATSNLPLRGGKGRQWEGGIREPYYIAYPKLISANTTSDLPVTGSDLYPTILDLAGLPLLPGEHVDGVSLKRVLLGQQDDAVADRALVWHYPHYDNQGGEPSSLIRRGEYKLIHYYLDGHDELYHLPTDVSEANDLSSQHPEKVASLKAELMSYLTSVDAKYPEPDPRFDPKKVPKRIAKFQGRGMTRLEAEHAALLNEDWQPNVDWWGSTVD